MERVERFEAMRRCLEDVLLDNAVLTGDAVARDHGARSWQKLALEAAETLEMTGALLRALAAGADEFPLYGPEREPVRLVGPVVFPAIADLVRS